MNMLFKKYSNMTEFPKKERQNIIVTSELPSSIPCLNLSIIIKIYLILIVINCKKRFRYYARGLHYLWNHTSQH